MKRLSPMGGMPNLGPASPSAAVKTAQHQQRFIDKVLKGGRFWKLNSTLHP